jgi:hypothetical protein
MIRRMMHDNSLVDEVNPPHSHCEAKVFEAKPPE